MPIRSSVAAEREAARNSTTTKIGGIFSNAYLSSEKIEKPAYTRWRISLGEEGRGRKLLDLTCPEDLKVLKGQNTNLSIGETRSGRHKLVVSPAEKQYLLLSSEGTYTRTGDGRVYWLSRNAATYTLLEHGWGADGAAGRIGNWDAVLIAVEGTPSEDWVCIRPGGRREWDTCKYVFMSPTEILYFDSPEDVRGFCEARDIEEPVYDWEDSVWEDVTKASPAEAD